MATTAATETMMPDATLEPAPTAKTAKPEEKSAELPTGIRLPYVEQGDPSGVPVLFLHGATDSWRSFELVLPYLPPSIHAFALTLRGHGDADRTIAGYHPRDFAADVAAWMNVLQLGPAVIAGHSLGSFVAQRVALDYPELTRGLVLIGSSSRGRGNAALEDLWHTTISSLTGSVGLELVREFQESTLAQPVPAIFFETIIAESLKVPARIWRALLQGLLATDHSRELSRIQTPTLIVWGDQDTLFSWEEQEMLAAAIPGAQLLVYPGAGHGVHWEEPKRIAADLTAFVETLTS